jgi:hypothetical protein
MGIYGFLISAPLGHFLVGTLQKAFAGRKGVGAKIGQLLANNLIIAPIQAVGTTEQTHYPSHIINEIKSTAYLASMAVINGAKSKAEVIKTVKAGFFAVVRVSDDNLLYRKLPSLSTKCIRSHGLSRRCR